MIVGRYRTICVTTLLLAASIAWAGWQQFFNRERRHDSVYLDRRRACAQLLTADEIVRAMPSVSARAGLRTDYYLLEFNNLYKCSMTVVVPGFSTIYIAVDVFSDTQNAGERMASGMRNGVGPNGGSLWRYFDEVAGWETFGNLLGLNEASAMDVRSNQHNLLLWRDHVYAEVVPTDGDVFSESERTNLGRIVYEHMANFPAFSR